MCIMQYRPVHPYQKALSLSCFAVGISKRVPFAARRRYKYQRVGVGPFEGVHRVIQLLSKDSLQLIIIIKSYYLFSAWGYRTT